LAWTDQIRSWLHNLQTRLSPAVIPLGSEFVGDEPVAEPRVVAVESRAALIRCASS
jgi:hypothetical protein